MTSAELPQPQLSGAGSEHVFLIVFRAASRNSVTSELNVIRTLSGREKQTVHRCSVEFGWCIFVEDAESMILNLISSKHVELCLKGCHVKTFYSVILVVQGTSVLKKKMFLILDKDYQTCGNVYLSWVALSEYSHLGDV